MIEQEKFLCDKWLGSGIHRAVYVCGIDTRMVVKIALGEEGRWFNILESKIWSELRDTKLAKWLAPVHRISDSGLMLLMERAELGRKQDYPKKVPHFLTDRKYNNYGWIKNQFVSIDYANTIITNGFTDRMIKADWWET